MEPTAWFYAVQGQQHGPVSVEELRRLVEQGIVRNESLVWHTGMATWQPLATVRSAIFPPEPGPVPNTELGSPSPRASGAPDLSGRRWASMAEVAARDYQFDYGARVGEAFDLLTKPNWNTYWAVLVGFLCILAAGIAPCAGLVALVVTGPLIGGIFLTVLKKRRTGSSAIGDIFEGFGPQFGALVGAHLLSALVVVLPVLLGVLVLLVNLAVQGFFNGGPPINPGNEAFLLLIPGIAAIFMASLAGLVLFSLVQWTVPLVADKGLGPIEALGLSWRVARKHWFSHVLLLILIKLIEIAGLFVLIIGLAFAIPLNATIYAVQYEKLFGDLEPRAKRV